MLVALAKNQTMTPKEKAEKMALFFHEEYETLAKFYNYETRPDTKVFDKNSPNGKLMIAVCESWIINELDEINENNLNL